MGVTGLCNISDHEIGRRELNGRKSSVALGFAKGMRSLADMKFTYTFRHIISRLTPASVGVCFCRRRKFGDQA